MQKLLLILTILLALILIALVISLPRENQQFFSETRSTIGKSGYWETNFLKKIILLIVSILLFLSLIFYMIQTA